MLVTSTAASTIKVCQPYHVCSVRAGARYVGAGIITTAGAGGGVGAVPAAGATVGVIMDGTNVLTGFAYPTAAAGGIQLASQLLSTDYTLTVAGDVMTVSPLGATTPANCSFTYSWTPVANGSPTVSPSTITGC